MRQRQTFLLTIITSDTDNASLCGQLKVIATGKVYTFTNLDELYRLITTEMDEETRQSFAKQGLGAIRQNSTASSNPS
jgi:hypothetical protein